jgi:hypothetical protein
MTKYPGYGDNNQAGPGPAEGLLMRRAYGFLTYLQRCVEPFRHVVPIDDGKEVVDELSAAVAVLQVIRMLPDVNHQQGNDAPLRQFLVILALYDGC